MFGLSVGPKPFDLPVALINEDLSGSQFAKLMVENLLGNDTNLAWDIRDPQAWPSTSPISLLDSSITDVKEGYGNDLCRCSERVDSFIHRTGGYLGLFIYQLISLNL